jgi:hypothetical protein
MNIKSLESEDAGLERAAKPANLSGTSKTKHQVSVLFRFWFL